MDNCSFTIVSGFTCTWMYFSMECVGCILCVAPSSTEIVAESPDVGDCLGSPPEQWHVKTNRLSYRTPHAAETKAVPGPAARALTKAALPKNYTFTSIVHRPDKTDFENEAAHVLDVSLRKLVVSSVPEQPREDPRDEPPTKNTAHLAQRK